MSNSYSFYLVVDHAIDNAASTIESDHRGQTKTIGDRPRFIFPHCPGVPILNPWSVPYLLVPYLLRLQAAPSPGQENTFHGDVIGSVIGSGNTVTIRNSKTVKPKYPPGCIGHNGVKANYISYLINRYHEFKEWEVGKESMRYGLFPSQLKKHFKIGAQRTIYNLPENRFEEVCSVVQQRIRGTKLARTKQKTKNDFYQSFEEYAQGQGA